MNKNFQNYTTSTAFQISMSRAQIEALYWFSLEESQKLRQVASNFPSQATSLLQRKGLLKTNVPYRITEEGKLVLKLCEMAGLLPARKLAEAA